MRSLTWQVHTNPFFDATSPLLFDFEHTDLEAAAFSTLAQGGFGDGQLTVKEPSPDFIRNAVDTWMMKRVVATDGAGRVAYEGFVAEIDARLNHHAYVRSIDAFSNRVRVAYKYQGQGSCPKGASCSGTQVVNEADVGTSLTQTEWGIKEDSVDITGFGIVPAAVALGAGKTFLRQSLRAHTIDFQLGSDEPTDNSITLTLWGYYSTLQWRTQNRSFRTLTDIGTIVATALSWRTGVQFISTDQSNIQTVGTTIRYNINAKKMPYQDYIQGAILNGDTNAKQLFFQILEDRKPYLFPRPAATRYVANYDDSRIWDKDHKVVPPYLVRAGSYILPETMNESLDPVVDILTRPHASFVNTTHYDDISGKLSIPPAEQVVSPERLFARARRNYRRYAL